MHIVPAPQQADRGLSDGFGRQGRTWRTPRAAGCALLALLTAALPELLDLCFYMLSFVPHARLQCHCVRRETLFCVRAVS